MVPPEEKETAFQAEGEAVSEAGGRPEESSSSPAEPAENPVLAEEAPSDAAPPGPAAEDLAAGKDQAADSQTTESAPTHPTEYGYYDDPYSNYGDEGGGATSYTTPESSAASTAVATVAAPPATAQGSGAPPPPPSGGGGEEEPDDDEDGMVRMSFFEHLTEFRRRILYALGGLGLAFALSLTFANSLWNVVSGPAVFALEQLKVNPPELAQIAPLEYFNIVWIKLPLWSAVFLSSPWTLYQLWAFIAPGLYKKERRWAGPFVLSTAGLFILGGAFAYFVAFRFALVFLLGLGIGNHVRPVVSVDEYFSIFVNITLGVGLVFELPVLIFFLTLIRVVTPGFLMRNIRYAMLAIFIIAAVVTPTPDIFNMLLFALPMCLLFFVGIGASYILILRREKRKFPWGKVLGCVFAVVVVIAALMYYLHLHSGYHFVRHFPWFAR